MHQNRMYLFILLASHILSIHGCPSHCQCFTDQVGCSWAGLLQFPEALPFNMARLNLTGNSIQQIEKDDTEHYPHLKALILSHNKIRLVEFKAQLPLELLDLSHNRVESLSFLPSLPNLTYLDMAHNQLHQLTNDAFSFNFNLIHLRLDGNPFLTLPSALFLGNNNLQHLSLSLLKIEEIPSHFIDPLKHLRYLDVSNCNKLKYLPRDLFQLSTSLQNLVLYNNNITQIPQSITNLKYLKELKIVGNHLNCKCDNYWFVSWLEQQTDLDYQVTCDDSKPMKEQFAELECSPILLESPTALYQAKLGESLILSCNFTGNPAPGIEWVTPNGSHLKWPFHGNGSHVTLSSANQLVVKSLSRETAGNYICRASNPLSNATASLKVQIVSTAFRKVEIQSIIVGLGCCLVFTFITAIIQGFRYIMDRCGWWDRCSCCGRRVSPRATQIRHFLDGVEQYKTQQLERLRENYNLQVQRIRENCVQQMERIHNSYHGQVKYLRGVRDYGTQHLTQIREQYNDQAKKVYEYTIERLHTVRRNYVSQRARVRKYSAQQLVRLRETYKFQQKTLNKLLENLPALYLDSCRSATCARTDSVYFEDVPEIDVVDSIIKQGITLDLPEIPLEEVSNSGLPDVELNSENVPEIEMINSNRKKGHGRNPSTGSLLEDLSFLFPRFPSRLSWKRRNTIDECPDRTDNPNSHFTAVQVAVEICPVPSTDLEDSKQLKETETDV